MRLDRGTSFRARRSVRRRLRLGSPTVLICSTASVPCSASHRAQARWADVAFCVSTRIAKLRRQSGGPVSPTEEARQARVQRGSPIGYCNDDDALWCRTANESRWSIPRCAEFQSKIHASI